jgi:predicted O-methyltransferase YrrM
MVDLKITQECTTTDITSLTQYTTWHPFAKYFELPSGQEHYRLLAYIAKQYDGKTLADIGTFAGFSAVAMSINPSNTIISYDISDQIPNMVTTAKSIQNINIRIKNIIESTEELKECPFIFCDIDPHDGVQEMKFVRSLIKTNYKGIVMFDDINLNPSMKSFWDWVPVPKYDLTMYGHFSGTGIACFGGATLEII